MNGAGWITLFYGILVLIGGIMGHVKAASHLSLIMGTVFGILLIICGVGITRDKLVPAFFGILLTLLLSVFFGYRFLITYSLFPAGIFCILSIIILIFQVILIKKHFKDQRNSNR